MTDRHCQNPACGVALMKPTQRRYCSHSCAAAGSRTRPLRSVTCPCGVTFTTTDPTARYHTDACRLKHGIWKKDQVTCLPRVYDRVWRY